MWGKTGAISFVILVWGYSWVVIKTGLGYMPPFLFSASRLLIGAALLLVAMLAMRKPLLPDRGKWPSVVLMGVLMGVGYMAALNYGMQFVNSGQSSVLVYTMPIFVSVIAHFAINERLTPMKTVGIAFGAAGIVSMIGFHTSGGSAQTMIGELFIIGSALSWALANVVSKVKFAAHEILSMTFWQLAIGGGLMLAMSLLLEQGKPVHWEPAAIFSVLFTGIMSTALTFVVWFWVLTKIPASTASMLLMLVPILGLFFGWLQLHEEITPNVLLGVGFICLGIAFAAYRSRKAGRAGGRGTAPASPASQTKFLS